MSLTKSVISWNALSAAVEASTIEDNSSSFSKREFFSKILVDTPGFISKNFPPKRES